MSLAQPNCLYPTWALIVKEIGDPDRILDMANQPGILSGEQLRIRIARDIILSGLYFFCLDPHCELTGGTKGKRAAQDPKGA
jgi:hypothetical protein